MKHEYFRTIRTPVIDASQAFVGHPTLKRIEGGFKSTRGYRQLKARFSFIETCTESNKVLCELINAKLKRMLDERAT